MSEIMKVREVDRRSGKPPRRLDRSLKWAAAVSMSGWLSISTRFSTAC